MITAFGSLPDGRPVHRVAIGGDPGPEAHLLTHGATLHRLEVTGGDGVRRDVTLGHPDLEGYLTGGFFLGATVGRYANRVARGEAEVDGAPARLEVNDRGNHLHGGPDGFWNRLWELVDHDDRSAHLRLVSPDGDEGFPGEVVVDARFAVDGDTLVLDLAAATDAPTLVNLTSHAYWNLAGGGSVDDHRLTVPASRFTPVDDVGIPLGDHAPVDGTPFDLRAGVRLGDAVRTPHPQTRPAQGIDHNLVLDPDRPDGVAAVLECPATATTLTLRSDQPGLQVYTGNFLDGTATDAHGRLLRQGDGLALEPQKHPDSPHHEGDPDWPTALLRPGETYRHRLSWTVGAS